MFSVKKKIFHKPVLKKEVLKFLPEKEKGNYFDLTFGSGGHTEEILRAISDKSKIYVIDIYKEACQMAHNLALRDSRVTPICKNFRNLKEIYRECCNDEKFDFIMADLGLSMDLIKSSGRGFTFMKDEPLDMRFGDSPVTAEEVINSYPPDKLEKIFREYGEEPLARKIAIEIVRERRKRRIASTGQLVKIIEKVKRRKSRIHPATQVFQALRIEVNNELENLKKMLEFIPEIMVENGIFVVISYHSLEDRVVKIFVKNWEKSDLGTRINKKVIVPSGEEVKLNPASRSARMRVFKFRG